MPSSKPFSASAALKPSITCVSEPCGPKLAIATFLGLRAVPLLVDKQVAPAQNDQREDMSSFIVGLLCCIGLQVKSTACPVPVAFRTDRNVDSNISVPDTPTIG